MIKTLILAAYRHRTHAKGSHTMIRIALGVKVKYLLPLKTGKKVNTNLSANCFFPDFELGIDFKKVAYKRTANIMYGEKHFCIDRYTCVLE